MIERRSESPRRLNLTRSWRILALGIGAGSVALAGGVRVGTGVVQKADVFNSGGGTLRGGSIESAANFGEPFSHPVKLAAGDFVMRQGFLAKKKNVQQVPVSVNPANAAPFVTRLAGSFPNPFNPRTTIRYELARDGAVSLVVFDVGGRLVRTLVDGPGTAGKHEARWDGRADNGVRLGDGMYFVRLANGDVVDEHKLLLLR